MLFIIIIIFLTIPFLFRDINKDELEKDKEDYKRIIGREYE